MRIPTCLAAAAALLLPPPALASELPPGGVDALVVVAMRDSLILTRLWRVVTEDPALRAELRRVGVGNGCRAMIDSRREVDARYLQILVPETVAALQAIVPEAVLAGEPLLSFFGGGLAPYREKVAAELQRTAAAKLSAAETEMRDSFLARTKPLPASADPGANVVWPRSDFAAMLGIDEAYDLTKAVPLGFACAEVQMALDRSAS